MTDLAARRADASANWQNLKREAGVAALDGQPFDPASLSNAATTVEVLEAAASEQEQRQREQDTVAYAARRAELATEGAEVARQYRRALERAETAAQTLSMALGHVLTNAAHMSRLAISLGVQPSPYLDRDALEKGLSQALGAALAPCSRQPRRFGYFQWASAVTAPTFGALNTIIPTFEEGTD